MKPGEKLKRINNHLYDKLLEANRKTEINQDGTMTGKNNILSKETQKFINEHNLKITKNGLSYPKLQELGNKLKININIVQNGKC